MYTTIRADSIKPGFVISFSIQDNRRKFYVLRILDNGNSDSIQFVAKPFDENDMQQGARPFTLKSDLLLFSRGYVCYEHSHLFQRV